jgi:hypothetical protein
MSFSKAPAIQNPVFNSNDYIIANSSSTTSSTSSDLLSLNNNWIGINTFQSLPICTQVPTTSAQIVNKLYVDTNFPGLASSNTFTGSNIFSSVPICAVAPTTSTHLTNKNYIDTNFSGLASTNTFTGVNNFQKINEVVVVSSGTATPFTCDYSLGNTFYIPTNYIPASNFQVIITNIPTDTSKSYTIRIMYYQASTTYFCNTARVSNTSSVYLLGTVSTFSAPLFDKGTPTLTISPCLIVQSFVISSVATSTLTFSRYVCSSVSSFY